MKRVLMISSFVAGSNVGGSVAMKVLSRLDVDLVLVPTTLLGRHPGWGAPGGGAVSVELFSGMIDGLIANGVPESCQAIVTGYFASADQVRLTAELIDKHNWQGAPVIVDAVMGDIGKGLYVKDEVAEAVVSLLVPRATVVKCNAWEFWEIVRRTLPYADMPDDAGDGVAIQHYFEMASDHPKYFVSSVRRDGKIGAICADGSGGYWRGHDIVAGDFLPNGLGDYLTCLIAKFMTERNWPANKLLMAAMGNFGPVFDAQDTEAPGELSLRTLGMVAETTRFASVEKLW